MKWEYMHALATSNTTHLNNLGNQGWELITAFRETNDDVYYIYKRPKSDNTKEYIYSYDTDGGYTVYAGDEKIEPWEVVKLLNA